MLQARNGSVVRMNVVTVESSLLPVSGTFPRFLPRQCRKKQQVATKKFKEIAVDIHKE